MLLRTASDIFWPFLTQDDYIYIYIYRTHFISFLWGNALGIANAATFARAAEMNGELWRIFLVRQADGPSCDTDLVSCVLCLVTSCHIWQGRERLRYLLFYILTRPPFLLIMNLPLGRNEDSEYLPHSMLTVLSFSSLWTCPLPAKATLWHS